MSMRMKEENKIFVKIAGKVTQVSKRVIMRKTYWEVMLESILKNGRTYPVRVLSEEDLDLKIFNVSGELNYEKSSAPVCEKISQLVEGASVYVEGFMASYEESIGKTFLHQFAIFPTVVKQLPMEYGVNCNFNSVSAKLTSIKSYECDKKGDICYNTLGCAAFDNFTHKVSVLVYVRTKQPITEEQYPASGAYLIDGFFRIVKKPITIEEKRYQQDVLILTSYQITPTEL